MRTYFSQILACFAVFSPVLFFQLYLGAFPRQYVERPLLASAPLCAWFTFCLPVPSDAPSDCFQSFVIKKQYFGEHLCAAPSSQCAYAFLYFYFEKLSHTFSQMNTPMEPSLGP